MADFIKPVSDQESEEYEILNQDGSGTGEFKSRDQIHADGDWHRVVHIWVVGADNKVLVQKRSSNKKQFPGMYQLNVAGHVGKQEDAVTTCLKELFEELGIKPQAEKLKHLFTTNWEHQHDEGIEREVQEVYMLQGEYTEDDLRINQEEVEVAEFSDLRDVEVLVQEHLAELVPQVEEYGQVLKAIKDAIAEQQPA